MASACAFRDAPVSEHGLRALKKPRGRTRRATALPTRPSRRIDEAEARQKDEQTWQVSSRTSREGLQDKDGGAWGDAGAHSEGGGGREAKKAGENARERRQESAEEVSSIITSTTPSAGRWTTIERCDATGPARWAHMRAHASLYFPRAPPGRAEGTAAALAAMRALTVLCKGCKATVHLQSASRAAAAAGRKEYAMGDGCFSRACAGSRHRPGRFLARQQAMAAALEQGKRLLINFPKEIGSRYVEVCSAEEVRRVLGGGRVR